MISYRQPLTIDTYNRVHMQAYREYNMFPVSSAAAVTFCPTDASSLTSYGLSLHPDLSDDGFARRKQRRNRTTFTLQQVNVQRFNILSFLLLRVRRDGLRARTARTGKTRTAAYRDGRMSFVSSFTFSC